MEQVENRDYAEVLQLQDASNISGLVHYFSRVMYKLMSERDAKKHGMEWVEKHPIVILLTDKLMSLTKQTTLDYAKAYEACKETVCEVCNFRPKLRNNMCEECNEKAGSF